MRTLYQVVRSGRAVLRAWAPAALVARWDGRQNTYDSKKPLFGGANDLFLSCLDQASVYGEYGVGHSTLFVLEATSIPVISVETSQYWAKHVMDRCVDAERLHVELVDVGEVGEYGRPLTYDRRQNFAAYPRALWSQPLLPDMVLIDGRFRVACFCQSVLAGRPGTRIVFDDYASRPIYHVVEEILDPECVSDRQAVFVIPSKVNREQVMEMLTAFTNVLD